MKKTTCLLLLAASLLTGTTSCKKYLDIRPYGKVIPKTPEEFASLLHYRLDRIDRGEGADGIVGSAAQLAAWDGGYGDDFEASLAPSVLPTYIGGYISSTAAYAPFNECYEIIRDCNLCIAGISAQSSKLGQNTLATAYALRGVAYYRLLRLYAEAPEAGHTAEQLGLPLILDVNIEARPQRATLQQTIEQVESDLKQAIQLGEELSVYLFTTDVARGYLCRLYFWSEQWDKAEPIARELLAQHRLSSGEDYKKETTERTGALVGEQLLKGERLSTVSLEYREAKSAIQQRPLSTRYLDAFPEAERATDIRYTSWVGKKRVVQKEFFAGLRSSELQLILAESYYHQGKKTEALAALNDLRSKRISPYTPLTEATLPTPATSEIIQVDATGKELTPLLAAILRERRKELLLEGDRFFELKRNGSPERRTFADGYSYVTQSYMYTLPLPPIDVFLSNLKQNKNYEDYISQ